MNKQEKKINYVDSAIIIGFIFIGIAIGILFTSTFYESQKFEGSKLLKGYDNDNLFKVEQTIACYKGCKLAEPADYYECTNACENYYLE